MCRESWQCPDGQLLFNIHLSRPFLRLDRKKQPEIKRHNHLPAMRIDTFPARCSGFETTVDLAFLFPTRTPFANGTPIVYLSPNAR